MNSIATLKKSFLKMHCFNKNSEKQLNTFLTYRAIKACLIRTL